MGRPLKVYVAGKVSKESHFGKHHWRDEFIAELEELSGRRLVNIDPTKSGISQASPETVFGADAYMIKHSDVVIVYLSDDISVGGSQEILIAKYYKKLVIGLAPLGKKFNGSVKELFGEMIKNYQDPFVFSTCDAVCATEEEVAGTLKLAESIKPRGIELIKELEERFQNDHLNENDYLKNLT